VTWPRVLADLFWAGGLGNTEIGKRLGTNRALADHIATHCSRYDSVKPGDRRNVVGSKASHRQVVRVGSRTFAYAYPWGEGVAAMEITGTCGIDVAQGPFEVFTTRTQERPPRKDGVLTVNFLSRDVIDDECLKFPRGPGVV
jgi:hypothetical protein